jgi:hypothetical protein
MRKILLFFVVSSLPSACRNVEPLRTDGGAADADTDGDTDGDSDADTDTDPFDDYDCEAPYSSICEGAVCGVQDQYGSAVEECAAGDELKCQLVEECFSEYFACVEAACAATQNPDPGTILDCTEGLTDCATNLAP